MCVEGNHRCVWEIARDCSHDNSVFILLGIRNAHFGQLLDD